MRKRRWERVLAVLVLAAAVAGCARSGTGRSEADPSLRLRFEDAPAPAVFGVEGAAVRDREGGADGYWAVVAGLRRPERARIVNLESGDEAVVALFAGRAGAAIRISNAAADALGMGTGPARVSVTALRSRPSLDTTRGRF